MILEVMKINTAITARAGPKRFSTTDPILAITSMSGCEVSLGGPTFVGPKCSFGGSGLGVWAQVYLSRN